MSNSPIAPTSTTGSSTCSASSVERPQKSGRGAKKVVPSGQIVGVERPEKTGRAATKVALIACGALSQPASEVVNRRGWPVDVHPLPPLLHNQPHKIADEVRVLAERLLATYEEVAIGYADCGTYGALDQVCDDLGLRRLAGLHCYDVYAGAERLEKFFEEQPGTYLFTDFLVRSFARTVEVELGLDRYPELRDVYFGSYTRVVWLAQQPTAELEQLAHAAADRIGLPLTVVPTGTAGLERSLADAIGLAVPA